MAIRKRPLKKGFSYEYAFRYMGKQYRKSGFKTKAEAVNAEQKARMDLELGKVANDKTVFKEIFPLYLEYIRCRHSASTFVNYQYIYKNYLSFFANYKTCDISPQLIEHFINKKLKETTPAAVDKAIRTAKAMFNYAIKMNIVSFNPFAKTNPIRLEKKTHKRLEVSELYKLLEESDKEDKRLKVAIALSTLAGLRRGELLGLKWDDIRDGYIYVERAFVAIGGLKDDLKTVSSRRRIKICKTLENILEEHRKSSYNYGEFIVSNYNGENYPIKKLHTEFKALLKKVGIEMRFHDLRGTYTDIALKANVPLKQIQRNLGHSRITTTMDIYSELLSSVEDESAIQFEEQLKKEGEKND